MANSSNTSKWIKALWILFFLSVSAIALMFVLIANGVIGYIPEIDELQNPKNKFATELYTSDGEMFGRYFYGKDNRVAVGYNEISPYVFQALVATEDERYYDHSGIDFKSLVRSIVKRGLLRQKSAGGGSTITQQLAKQLYSPTAKSLFQRALQKPIEWVIAVQLEKYYSKEEILVMYLNQFDFLNNAVGIKSAAQVYFNCAPADLNIEQSAMLVGMCKNPSYFNPNRFPERAQGRRNTVLEQMEKNGNITEPQLDSLQQIPLTLDFNKIDHRTGIAPYFREYLRLMLTAKKPVRSEYASWQDQKFKEDSIAWQTNPLYGWCNKNTKPDGSNYNIYTDGLRIFTTIDSRMQRYAEEAVSEHITGYLQQAFFKEKKNKSYAPFSKDMTPEEIDDIMNRSKRQSERYIKMSRAGHSKAEIDKAFNTPTEMRIYDGKNMVDTTMTPMDSIRWDKYFLRCGFMSISPSNGHVKAYVGGPNFAQFQYDMVNVGKRQVGSTIKPYLYTLAMEQGMSPCDEVPNVQPTFYLGDSVVWAPRNDSEKRVGEMVSLRWALSQSNNWVSAYLIREFGPHALVKLMHSFGILSNLDPVVALCLGPAEVSVKEMVDAYTTFVNKGIRVDPMYVTRIEDNKGNVLATFAPKFNEIISEETSYKMLTMLQAVVNEGTGVRLRYKYSLTAPIGGKTGTTQNNSDGWFIGVTPQLVSGAWVGGEDRSIHFDSMAEGQGASMALPIWALYMTKVFNDKSLGYSQDVPFDIPKEALEQYNCKNKPQTNKTSSDNMFGDEF
ncbi:MAG: transglycosylase domain-containing protein [Paludibacteraceae bacterium]|nr:transglycosylase domain-containing protein [Paludibacteraceae bacterium]